MEMATGWRLRCRKKEGNKMKYIVVDREDKIWPFANEYEAENEKEALKMFIAESKNLVASFKNISFTFKLVNNTVKEFVDGEFDGVEFIAREERVII